jgi:hypothetical protein
MDDWSRVEDALALWCGVEQYLRRPSLGSARRAACERAVVTALGGLQGPTTLVQLVDAYFGDRAQVDDPQLGEYPLSAVLVGAAACRRRARQLLQAR